MPLHACITVNKTQKRISLLLTSESLFQRVPVFVILDVLGRDFNTRQDDACRRRQSTVGFLQLCTEGKAVLCHFNHELGAGTADPRALDLIHDVLGLERRQEACLDAQGLNEENEKELQGSNPFQKFFKA